MVLQMLFIKKGQEMFELASLICCTVAAGVGLLLSSRMSRLSLILEQILNTLIDTNRFLGDSTTQPGIASKEPKPIVHEVKKKYNVDMPLRQTSILKLNLRPRTAKCLHNAGILNLGHLLDYGIPNLKKINRFGPGSVMEVIQLIKSVESSLPRGNE